MIAGNRLPVQDESLEPRKKERKPSAARGSLVKTRIGSAETVKYGENVAFRGKVLTNFSLDGYTIACSHGRGDVRA